RRRRHELPPALGQDPLALPDAVVQVKQSQSRPVARRTVVMAVEEKVAVRIGLEDLTTNADLVEQCPLRPGEILVAALAHGIANEHPECQRITVSISPDGVRLELLRPCRRELERVDRTGVAEVMIMIAGDVFWTAAAEAQSTRHAHEIDDADLGARVARCLSPL